jgi:hypothetical protein
LARAAQVLGLPLVATTTAADTDLPRLANLDHLDYMYDEVSPPEQEGYATYRLEEEPEIGVVWVYCRHEPDNPDYCERRGGNTYDPETDTWDNGTYDTDDITRVAVGYIRHWRQYGDAHSMEQAYQLLRGTAYFQRLTGENRGNFMIWMQQDGTLNHEALDGSDDQANWSLARGIWALGEGYAAFRDDQPDFARFLEDRLELSFDALDREVLDKYGQYQTVDGLSWPKWFIPGCWCEPFGDAGATADAMQGLVAYLKATEDAQDPRTAQLRQRAAHITTQFAEGLEEMALGDAYTWPFGALMPNPGYRAMWHGWGTMMPGVLADAGVVLDRPDWIQTAADSLATFAPHVLVQGGPDAFWAPTPVLRIQWGFSVDNLVQNLYKVGTAADSQGLRDLAGVAAAWYFGDNYGAAQMYDPASGRLYDGLEGNGNVNRNAGAETTHAVMSMLLLEANPDLAARALAFEPGLRHTWEMVEAEDGTLSGDATLSEPCTFIVAEGWCSGREVILRDGGSVTMKPQLARPGRYLVMPAVTRQQAPAGAVQAAVSVNNRDLATIDVGGAGPQGVTPRPGYFDIVTIREPVEAGRRVAVEVAHAGAPDTKVDLDGVLLQPEVEIHVLGTSEGSQAVLRSFSDRLQTEPVVMPSRGLTAHSYDQAGHLVGTVTTEGRAIQAPVAPGGFTIITSHNLANGGSQAR